MHAELAPDQLSEPMDAQDAKKPAERGFSHAPKEDSNLHPVIPDQALNLVHHGAPGAQRRATVTRRWARPADRAELAARPGR